MSVTTMRDLVAVYLAGDPAIGWAGAFEHFRRPHGRSGTAEVMKGLLRKHLTDVSIDVAADDPRATTGGLFGAQRRLGDVAPGDFTAADLRLCRQHMIDCGCTRSVCNDYCSRIRTFIAWAISYELCPQEVLERVKLVAGLRAGTAQAAALREGGGVRSVPDDQFEAACRCANLVTEQAMRVQALTGMRPGELLAMRRGDVTPSAPGSGRPWYYVPPYHKTDHRGKTRRIAIGPAAQAILQVRLDAIGASGGGGTLGPSSGVVWPWRTVQGYANSVRRASTRAGCPFGPYRLRHTFATRAARLDADAGGGLEAARQQLGHSDDRTTRIYVDPDMSAAERLIMLVG